MPPCQRTARSPRATPSSAGAEAIVNRGYLYGESRVIVGAHWQSDVNAGYLYASVAYAKLHTSDRFLKQMEKARKEFKKLSGKK